jgi:hypothetical protein
MECDVRRKSWRMERILMAKRQRWEYRVPLVAPQDWMIQSVDEKVTGSDVLKEGTTEHLRLFEALQKWGQEGWELTHITPLLGAHMQYTFTRRHHSKVQTSKT